MANVAPLPFEPQASGHRAENLLLADSGLVVEGIVETDTISQDAIDYVFKPHPSDSERLAGQNTHTAPWYRRATPWFLFPVIIFSACLFASTAAPRNEILINLACAYHRPEYYVIPVMPSEGPTNTTLSAFSTIMTNMPSPDRRCSSDPVILSAVAKLVTVQSLVLGILTCLTAGWWGQMSDRHGRKLILSISVVGLMLNEANIIFVSRNQGRVPGGYWFLVVTSAIDGCLGGLATAGAAAHAYIADCVEPQARSRVFSLYLGALFIGIALGPSFGSLLIQQTGDILTPFYVAVTIHILTSPFYLFVLPESLSVEARATLTRKQHEVQEEHTEAVRQAKASGLWHTRQRFLALFGFLSPLAIFLPKKVEGSNRRDWNLTLVIVAYGIIYSQMSLINYKTLYTIAIFGWRSEELGYFLSVVGITRALHMVVILPLVTRLLKPCSPAISLPIQPNESEPLLDRSDSAPEDGQAAAAAPPTASPHAVARLDLKIARVSLLIDLACYIVITASGGPAMFIAGSLAISLGGGFGPAISSLAMHLFGGQESGKLFAAMAVVSTIGSSLAGPAIFGPIWITTVGTFPKAIFVMAAAGVVVAFVAMLLIRLPDETTDMDLQNGRSESVDEL
ncbi:hypothetical protein FRB95_009577 [Tulasnella sp. JGI-2019a]|nr:hypothetical protein FRB95_009577 [Tulasnella sp. JGI-2019a]